MQNSNLLTKIINNTKEKMIKFFKTKRYIIHLMIILPFTAISYVQYLFNHQRIEVYGKNAFSTEIKLLFSYGDKKNNFDVYILDRNHEIDFIFFHGASILEEKYKKRLEFLCDNLPYNIICPFYRGFCTSKGEISEINIMTDCHILSKELEKRKKKTVVYGISMGAAVGIYYCTFSDVERLVLENPFLDLCNVVKDFPIKRIFTFLITEKWPSNKRIEKVNCEITFILSEKDKLIFNENGEDLAELCKNDNVYYIRNAGHSNAFVVSKIYKKILIDGLNCEEELK